MKYRVWLLLCAANFCAASSAMAAEAPTPAPASAADPDPQAASPEPPQLVADPPAAEVQPQAVSPTLGEKAKDAATAALPSDTPAPADTSRDLFSRMRGDDPNAYSIVSVSKGLSTHKPMYILPATYSPDYTGAQTEVIFAISAKVQLFGTPFYFGYSQRSFWQVYDSDRSRPFRETDYNPELFYRWTPDPKKWHYWGADIGAEHESNGQDVPDSRSWNRLYIAPFRAEGKSLWYLKAWYRIPEDKKKTPDDPKGDDNPDIEDHYGYGEIHYQQQIGKRQVIHTMVRMNPETGHGALNVNYTIPSRDGSVFYQVYLWQGYGESLLDYDRSITRIGVGVAFSR
ncbi:MAG: Phospholipase [Hydrocarboniphaga sp.]|uniref:phospholipase A n=1 Tax=Hydrocarboniphaga sp. TaxID=2033016 RepID=UPI002635DF8B|nr:phospholipase A [Hydrocarboniphaga sp.]MDB5972859.1 Phospholipase [Hydrocarboniphaga sp.]